ncbi:hypothetical protein [Listeria seeligeri]|uniref:hypothetical protein n=1 Tax=Listeria seeligeri TaxID=1640 RepID=UPI0010EB9FC4|nr:hypothetical protein [Listeria seeligeri]MBC1472021.1 hypothetical protein [Listeria seeligeri]MBC1732825.1 hypothetical protein [Listeria seeligeri]MBC1810633.1 hypothetical protein [Listeria seeligeri]MBC1895826.1 hypothetical protein [Listeria seeligeri]MBC1901678.1 hypothetical protein [Listeria seeligeri]
MKKIIGGVLIIVLIALFVWRVYDLNANSFSYENRLHSEQEAFQLENTAEVSVENAVIIEDSDIKKYVEEKNYFKNENEKLLIVQAWSTEKNIGVSDFQLGYQDFVTLSDISATSYEYDEDKGQYKIMLGFNVPKELLDDEKEFMLVVPSKYWNKGTRDVVEVSL